MPVSIAWLLQQKSLGLDDVTEGTAIRREILFVQPTELRDPTRWLSGGELVLTTGLDLVDGDDDSLREYVYRLGDAGVAALAFGTGLSHDEVPPAVVDAARNIRLTLLRVPFVTPFAAITKAVMGRLAQQEYREVLDAAAVQTRITRAALQGESSILRELSVATGNVATYVGRSSATVHPPGDTTVIDEVRHILSQSAKPAGTASLSVSTPGRTLTLHRVGLGTAVHGYVAMASAEQLGSIERMLLGHAASLLTLDREKPWRLRAERARLNRTALEHMLGGLEQSGRSPEYLDDALDEAGHLRVAVIDCGDVESVAQQLDASLAELGRSAFTAVADGVLVALLPASDARTILADVSGGRLGVSAPHAVGNVAVARDEARIALGEATARDRVVEFDAFSGASVVGSAPAREALLAVAASGLEALERHDIEQGTALMESLRAYLDAHGHWESAAAELGVHRHTLRGRITRCEELLRCDFQNARVRAEVLLALVVWSGRARP